MESITKNIFLLGILFPRVCERENLGNEIIWGDEKWIFRELFSGGGWGWKRTRHTLSFSHPNDVDTSTFFKQRLLKYEESEKYGSKFVKCVECGQIPTKEFRNFHEISCSKSPYAIISKWFKRNNNFLISFYFIYFYVLQVMNKLIIDNAVQNR